MENQSVSAFQQQFPLSPKKFWKMMVGSLLGSFIILVLFLAFAIISVTLISVENRIPFVWPIFFGVFTFIIVYLALRAWYLKVYIFRYFYSASDSYVTMKMGVFAPAEIHVQYQKIQDVYVDQDILDRIMGLYDVHIASATVTSGIEAHIDGVEEAAADGLKEFFLNKISGGGPSDKKLTPDVTSSQIPVEIAKPLDASQMISSEQYPIGPQWIQAQGVSAIFTALTWTIISLFYTQFNFTVGLVVFIAVLIGRIVYLNVWKGHFHFAFLPDYIELSTQVIAKSEQHMPYRTVQDVIVKQGVIERMFGLATVYIQNAANQPMQRGNRRKGGPQAIRIPGQTPENANKIAEVVRAISLTKNSGKTGL